MLVLKPLIKLVDVILFATLLIIAGCATGQEFSSPRVRSADELVDQKKYDEAIVLYKSAQVAHPTSIPVRLRLASAYNQLARTSEAIFELQEALAILDKQRDDRPSLDIIQDKAEILFMLGQILERAGKISEAIAYYEQSRTLLPNRTVYRLALVRAYVRAQRLDAAKQEFSQHSEFISPHFLLGLAYLKANQFELAEREFNGLSAHAGDFPTVNVLAAFARLAVTRPTAEQADKMIAPAKKLLQEAASKLGSDLLIYLAHARILELEGKLTDASELVSIYNRVRHATFNIDVGLKTLLERSALYETIQRVAAELEAGWRTEANAKYQHILKTASTDKNPPQMSLDLQALTAETRYPFVVISGVVRDNYGVASVQINHKRVRINRREISLGILESGDEIEFLEKIDLKVGENVIVVRAEDEAGNWQEQKVIIVRTPTVWPVGFYPERRWALFVSVSRYLDPKIPRPEGLATDSLAMIERLSAGIPATQVEKLVDSTATLGNILKALAGLFEVSGTNDEVLLYFNLGLRALPAGEHVRYYLTPFDTRTEDLPASSIEVGKLSELLHRSRARTLVIILNTEQVASMFEKDPIVRQPGRVVVGASPHKSFSVPSLRDRGLFLPSTIENMDALSIKGGKEVVVLFDLFTRTKEQVEKLPPGFQQPILLGDEGAARAFVLPQPNINVRLLERLVTLANERRIGRHEFLKAMEVVVRGATDADSASLAETLSKFGANQLTVAQLVQELSRPKESLKK